MYCTYMYIFNNIRCGIAIMFCGVLMCEGGGARASARVWVMAQNT